MTAANRNCSKLVDQTCCGLLNFSLFSARGQWRSWVLSAHYVRDSVICKTAVPIVGLIPMPYVRRHYACFVENKMRSSTRTQCDDV